MSSIFDGIRVIDFTNNLAGPGATAMLADFGAEVIKIERPVAGDDIRGISPRLEGQAIFGLWSNRGKKSITLALDDPRSKEILYKMIKDADIVAESFKPGQMKKFGLDYESIQAIQPKIIYLSVSACGQTGAYAKKPGFDIIAQAMSGQMDLTGNRNGPPTRLGVPIGDYVGAFNAAFSMAAALYHRDRTGEGQHIDLSLLDGMVSMNSTLEGAANLDTHPTRSGNHYLNMAPYGVYQGKDGQSCVISAYTGGAWVKLCNLMGKPELIEDPRTASNVSRTKNIDYLVEQVESWLKTFDDIGGAIQVMESVGIACCKIKNTDEVVADQNLWERGTIVEVETPPSFQEHRTVKRRGTWIHMSKTPAVQKRAPDLGEDNYHYLTQYGLTKEEIDSMQAQWAEKFKKQ
ncbi:MAG: CoA transferase [Oscillospiraceae bacterium]|nr:CoA transferase [Oscillospiraceae bacterium]